MWGCLWVRLAFEPVPWIRQIILHCVSESCLIHWVYLATRNNTVNEGAVCSLCVTALLEMRYQLSSAPRWGQSALWFSALDSCYKQGTSSPGSPGCTQLIMGLVDHNHVSQSLMINVSLNIHLAFPLPAYTHVHASQNWPAKCCWKCTLKKPICMFLKNYTKINVSWCHFLYKLTEMPVCMHVCVYPIAFVWTTLSSPDSYSICLFFCFTHWSFSIMILTLIFCLLAVSQWVEYN